DLEPRSLDRVGDVELEIERVFGTGALVGLQPHHRALRLAGDDLEAAGTREAVLRERIFLAVEGVVTALHRTDDREQDRRAAFPILRIAVPQQIAALSIGQ